MSKSIRFNVSASIWQWVLNTSIDLLNKKMKHQIDAWLSHTAKKDPTIKEIKNISRRTRLPFGYFFASKPPKREYSINPKFVQFRTINNKAINYRHPSVELIRTVKDIKSKSDWLANYRINHDESSFSFVGKYRNNYKRLPDKIIADGILNYLHLPLGWNYNRNRKIPEYKIFGKLKTQSSKYGISVLLNGSIYRRPLRLKEFRAFVIVNRYAPFIFINTKDCFHARLFSLIHELVHVCIGFPELLNYNFEHKPNYIHSTFEQNVNKIVEIILFPKKLFVQKWEDDSELTDVNRVYDVSHHFGASAIATAIRALHLDLISEDVVNYIRNRYRKYGNNHKSAYNPAITYRLMAYKMDNTLAFDVIRSIHSGQTSYHRAFRLLNVNGAYQFSRLVRELKK